METRNIKKIAKPNKTLLSKLTIILILLFTGSMVFAQGKPECITEKNNNKEITIKVKNPQAYQWYLLYHIKPDGSYNYLEAQSSDGSDIKYSKSYLMAGRYEVFEYKAVPQSIPQVPDNDKRIKGFGSVPEKK